MAKDKKFVESITDMEVDFPQWYTDVVIKADLVDLFKRKRLYDYKTLRIYYLGTYAETDGRKI